MKKQLTFTTANTYETLNELTSHTKNVWMVFHGIGYLSRFFVTHFSQLNAEKNYIICPQAPSKYYKDENYRKVGACWLTKEDTGVEIENVLNYIDAIVANEGITEKHNLILFGYSQGVSIASRWLGLRQRMCQKLICASGVFPLELTKAHFEHLPDLKVAHTVGNNDPLFEKSNVRKQEERLKRIFPQLKLINHEGGHQPVSQLFDDYLNI